MIKIPGTPEGMQAIEDTIAAGINVNVTLLFAVSAYEDAARAYIRGLERYADTHSDLSRISSVASFFLSRIDTAVDKKLEAKAQSASGPERDRLLALRGKAAIANAKIAYERFQMIFSGPQWDALARKGATKQRVLWASTGTKNPAYPDTYYVDTLIGPDTVNTVPPATLDAFLDHGKVADTVTKNVADAHKVTGDLADAGISLDEVTDTLLTDGVKLFTDAFDKLIAAVKEHQPK